ncbi:MAG: hypothetical protein FK734_01630 [Asgard group archaeon]|nr:hypothetical protein [Asgard group archaeon]
MALYRQSYENTKSPFGSVRERIITFCIDYVNYLRTQIAKRALDFEIVFQLSGPRVLTFYLKDFPEVQAFVLDKITVLLENHSILSSAQQISYLTLLLLAKQLEFSPEILALYERHQDLIATFIEKHTKLLPDEELDIIKERDEVFNFYLK